MTATFTVKGIAFTIDDIDADLLDHYWRHCYSNKGKPSEIVYAQWIVMSKGKYVGVHLLHREVLSRVLNRPLLQGECVDHIDGNPANNVRANLRIATHFQNAGNRKRRIDNKTGYKGVTKLKGHKGYTAKIYIAKKAYVLGTFDTPEEAHAAYLEAAKKHFGDFARGE